MMVTLARAARFPVRGRCIRARHDPGRTSTRSPRFTFGDAWRPMDSTGVAAQYYMVVGYDAADIDFMMWVHYRL